MSPTQKSWYNTLNQIKHVWDPWILWHAYLKIVHRTLEYFAVAFCVNFYILSLMQCNNFCMSEFILYLAKWFTALTVLPRNQLHPPTCSCPKHYDDGNRSDVDDDDDTIIIMTMMIIMVAVQEILIYICLCFCCWYFWLFVLFCAFVIFCFGM